MSDAPNLLSAPSVTVKPLEWRDYDNPVFAGPDVAIADVQFNHRYHVQRDPWAATFMALLHPRLPITSSTLWWESKGHEDLDAAKAAAQADYETRIMAAIQVDPTPGWQPISTAPHDRDILVWYDHDADPYQDPDNPKRLTSYATWADGGDFLDGRGFCIAKRFPRYWEAFDKYGSGHWMPAAWFALENDDYARVVNPIFWKPLDVPPTTG